MHVEPREYRKFISADGTRAQRTAGGQLSRKTTMRPVEQLEPRRLLASFTASSVAELITDINAANAAGGANVITLTEGTTFKLNAVAEGSDGATGLPTIAAGNELTIAGNGDTIERSSGAGTPAFRLFDVAAGAVLSLNDLTLSRGRAPYSSFDGAATGGAIRNHGALILSGVTVQNCTAQGDFAGQSALGGGIFSAGVLTAVGSAIRNNQALGMDGGDFGFVSAGIGGSASGGGLYLAGTSASLTNSSVDSNLARAGNGGSGGKGQFFGSVFWFGGGPGGGAGGGGIFAAAATVQLQGTSITRNVAKGGTGGSSPRGLPKGADGPGRGGGLFIAPPAVVGLDSTTQANTRSNTASTSDDDIFGSFTLLA